MKFWLSRLVLAGSFASAQTNLDEEAVRALPRAFSAALVLCSILNPTRVVLKRQSARSKPNSRASTIVLQNVGLSVVKFLVSENPDSKIT